jgi:hypothetical protein
VSIQGLRSCLIVCVVMLIIYALIGWAIWEWLH